MPVRGSRTALCNHNDQFARHTLADFRRMPPVSQVMPLPITVGWSSRLAWCSSTTEWHRLADSRVTSQEQASLPVFLPSCLANCCIRTFVSGGCGA